MRLVQALQEARISHLDLSGSIRVRPGAAVGDVLARMREARATVALVEDQRKRLVGIFTERDALLKVADDPAALSLAIDKLMTANPRVVSPDDRVGAALHFMNEGHFRNVPVLDAAGRLFVADVFQGELIVFSAERDDDDRAGYLPRRWAPHVDGVITAHRVDCTHQDMLGSDTLEQYGPQLRRLLGREAP